MVTEFWFQILLVPGTIVIGKEMMGTPKSLRLIKYLFGVVPDKVTLFESKLIQFRSIVRCIIFGRS